MKAILHTGFLSLAIVLALAVPANAGPLEDGLVAAQQGDYATALRHWRPLAEQGIGEVQYNLAAAQDNPFAKQFRDKLASKMTSDQIAEAQRMAREWMAKHQQP